MSISRTMMLHSAIHWPEIADTSLWPMLVARAVYLCNHVPNSEVGLSAHDPFTMGTMTYMPGAVHFTSLKRHSPTARSYLAEGRAAIAPSTWDSLLSTQAPFH
jgi:hypothetical protein